MRWFAGIAAALVAIAVVTVAPAAAHEGEKSEEAGVLVRQAIALIVNTPKDGMAIEDKITDAIESEDVEGVNVDLVEQASVAFEDGDLHRARALLEASIGARPHLSGFDVMPVGRTHGPMESDDPQMAMRMATGEESGTDVVIDPLDPPHRFDAGTWAALAAAVGLGAVGVALAVRFRPPVSLRSLRARAEGTSA